MKNQLFFSLIVLAVISFFCSSCEDTNLNELVGTWDYRQAVVSDCNNLLHNETLDYTGDGDCEVINNVTTCTKFSLEMDESNYTLHQVIIVDGNETSSILEAGTYTVIPNGVVAPSIQFCTDLICRSEGYAVSGNSLTLQSEDPNNGCNTVLTAEKR